MKINSKNIIPFGFFVLNQIIQSNAQYSFSDIFHSPYVKAAQSSQTTITNEQLNSFSYGKDQFKLAIIGDSGTEKEANEVMKLTSFDALLHLGDYDYGCSPDKYFNEVLDRSRKYQFMGILGNHDAKHECSDSEAERFKKNVYNEMTSSKNSRVKCEFSSSKFMWSCVYKNMRIIGLTPGINGADNRKEQLAFLKKHLNNASEDWKICSWHYYDKYYHTGKYPNDGDIVSGHDSDSESFYDYCREQGAIIFSAHDHVYARTHVMSQFKKPTIDKYDSYTDSTVVQIRKGATIDILNGTGGWEIYVEQGEQKNYSHWQKKYARGSKGENAKKYGGLFCDFNYGGNPRKAYCQFLRINSSDKVFDSFYIYRNENPSSVKYTKIDEDFKNEKLNAYKVAHNIPGGVPVQNNNSNTNINTNNNNNNLDINTNGNINNNTSTNNASINPGSTNTTINNDLNPNNDINSNNVANNGNSDTSNNISVNNNTDGSNLNIQTKEKESKTSLKTFVNTTTISIGGSVCVAIAAISGGIFLYKRSKKYDNIPKSMTLSFYSTNGTYNNNNNNSNVNYTSVKTNDNNHVIDGFASDKQNEFYQNQDENIGYDQPSYYSDNYNDNYPSNSRKYNYYTGQPDIDNGTSPLVTVDNNYTDNNKFSKY